MLALARKRGAKNIRIFGSVSRHEARPDSDIDLLIDLRTGMTAFWMSVVLPWICRPFSTALSISLPKRSPPPDPCQRVKGCPATMRNDRERARLTKTKSRKALSTFSFSGRISILFPGHHGFPWTLHPGLSLIHPSWPANR
ncbi:nucleotidyltransferase family protein [Methanoregula boonei]|uniref:nucleotidyltransferase family protein n=1 Tax=Methanoregula boonei TaxID=358766 RepID=UPI00373AE75D